MATLSLDGPTMIVSVVLAGGSENVTARCAAISANVLRSGQPFDCLCRKLHEPLIVVGRFDCVVFQSQTADSAHLSGRSSITNFGTIALPKNLRGR